MTKASRTAESAVRSRWSVRIAWIAAAAVVAAGAATESAAASSWQVSSESRIDLLGTMRKFTAQTISVGTASSPYNWKTTGTLALPRIPLAFGQYIDFFQNGTGQGVVTSSTGKVTLDLPLRLRDSSGSTQTFTAYMTTAQANGINSDGGPYCTGGSGDPSYCRGSALDSSGKFRMVAIVNIPQAGGTLGSGALFLLEISGTMTLPCVGTVCTASDACHVTGTCDPATGLCSNPAAPNGTTCSDGNACTRTDSCQNGTCVGANPVVCAASDPCHSAGTCNSATGTCSNPVRPDGTLCDDGNACTTADRCTSGSCAGVTASIPAEVDSGVRLLRGGGTTAITWNPVSGSESFDVARGLLGSLPAGAAEGETCVVNGLTGTTAMDDGAPSVGAGYWYLVRGTSPCGAGPYGFQGLRGVPSTPRITGICAGPCVTVADCPGTDTECRTRSCTAGWCAYSYASAGVTTGAQTPGDCRRNVCDGSGGVSSAIDDTDLPNDANSCTNDVCGAGVPSHPPSAARTPCGQGGGTVCDGAGSCVPCVVASDCPGTDTDCKTRTCGGDAPNACGFSFAASGTATTSQVAGDCRRSVCDGSGGLTTLIDNTDLPDDANPCTHDVCTSGTPSNPPVAAGTACSAGSTTGFCDGSGTCAPCGNLVQRCCASYPYCRPGLTCRSGFCR